MGGKICLINSEGFLRRMNKLDEKYILIPKSEINEELKRNIIELEKLGEECSKVLQKSMKMYSKSRENPI